MVPKWIELAVRWGSMEANDTINTKAQTKFMLANETENLVEGSEKNEDDEAIKRHSVSKSPMMTKKDSISSQSKKVKDFYERQNSLLEKYEDDSKIVNGIEKKLSSVKMKAASTGTDLEAAGIIEETIPEEAKLIHQATSPRITVYDRDDVEEDAKTTAQQNESAARRLALLTLLINIALMLIKALASYLSDAKTTAQQNESAARRLALLTLLINIALMLIKALASYLSGSLSIISSLVDSLVDITSGLVIWMTARAIRKRDPYLYPRGRTRLEPLALVIVSVVMAVASVQMLIQAVKMIIDKDIHPKVDITSIGIMVTTVVVKFGLFLACKMHKDDASIAVLAQDHRNDCVSNTVALLCAIGATHLWLYLDPIGAILVSLYIALTWYGTGKEQLKILSGRSAEPEFINRIIKICIDHDSEIQFIDTVYVYHFGLHFLVEVHIVLDPEMPLRKAHDIAEALQIKLEALPEVERSFVHTDFEFLHLPHDEHKIV
uniref:Cation efflux protein cytoplasmic domain-containing protein n=1 Tax=Panagrolaimus sp. JU765 TaxID=591449 RepID=A0AC34RNA2_9BILA